jgi:hypothetical protein
MTLSVDKVKTRVYRRLPLMLPADFFREFHKRLKFCACLPSFPRLSFFPCHSCEGRNPDSVIKIIKSLTRHILTDPNKTHTINSRHKDIPC